MRANGPGPLGAEARRMTLHPGLWVVELANLGIVLGVVWNMTEKPGWGGSIAAVVVGYAVGAALALLLLPCAAGGARAGRRRRGLTVFLYSLTQSRQANRALPQAP